MLQEKLDEQNQLKTQAKSDKQYIKIKDLIEENNKSLHWENDQLRIEEGIENVRQTLTSVTSPSKASTNDDINSFQIEKKISKRRRRMLKKKQLKVDKEIRNFEILLELDCRSRQEVKFRPNISEKWISSLIQQREAIRKKVLLDYSSNN